MLGAYGMLGHRMLLELGHRFDVAGTVRAPRKWDAPIMEQLTAHQIITGVDAFNIETVRSTIRQYRPRAVVNCIGIVKQAEAAKDPIASITINSLFPHQVAKAVHEVGGTLVHFSTDCVFSGREGHYSQDRNPDPEDLYGRSKLLGEVAKNGVTVRSSLIGRELGTSHGLVEWLLSNRGRAVTGFRRAIFSGLPTQEMAKVVGMLIERMPVTEGVWHVATDPISKFDLLSRINAEAKTGITILPDDSVAIDRSLDSSPFSQATGYRAPGWDDMIKAMVKEFPLYEQRG